MLVLVVHALQSTAQKVSFMSTELPRRGSMSPPKSERQTLPDCPASRAPAEPPRLSLQDGTLPGALMAGGRTSSPSLGPVDWPGPETAPARDLLLCAVGALVLALIYVYW